MIIFKVKFFLNEENKNINNFNAAAIPDMVSVLLMKKRDSCLKVKDIFGKYTPMLRTVQSGCMNIVEYLFDNGVSPDDATGEGWMHSIR